MSIFTELLLFINFYVHFSWPGIATKVLASILASLGDHELPLSQFQLDATIAITWLCYCVAYVRAKDRKWKVCFPSPLN